MWGKAAFKENFRERDAGKQENINKVGKNKENGNEIEMVGGENKINNIITKKEWMAYD